MVSPTLVFQTPTGPRPSIRFFQDVCERAECAKFIGFFETPNQTYILFQSNLTDNTLALPEEKFTVANVIVETHESDELFRLKPPAVWVERNGNSYREGGIL